MRIWKIALLGLSVVGLSNGITNAQTVAAPSAATTPVQNRVVSNGIPLNSQVPTAVAPQDVRPVLGSSPSAPVITPQDVQPALGNSATTPAITPQGVTPALAPSTPALGAQTVTPVMPTPQTPVLGQPNSTRINPPQGFTTGIGQQGSGTAIGQQGTTAIGQQGNTAIGQQGFGTAINPPANGVVIGQPEPFTPATSASVPPPTPVRPSPILPSQAAPPMVATPVPQSPASPVAPLRPMPPAPTAATRVALPIGNVGAQPCSSGPLARPEARVTVGEGRTPGARARLFSKKVDRTGSIGGGKLF